MKINFHGIYNKTNMKQLFTNEEFISAKGNDKLPCECYECSNTFYQTKNDIIKVLNPNHSRKGMYCSKKCQSNAQITKKLMICLNCGIEFERNLCHGKKSKSGNQFCSISCAAQYNNTHKTIGNRRSKLEKYLEEQLTNQFPNMLILFNDKTTINSELDIYIPSIKLAFELNGIFHYEPIYGQEKLNQIQNNDNRKFQACLEQNIELCILDTSKIKYLKKAIADEYLSIITTIINNKSMNN